MWGTPELSDAGVLHGNRQNTLNTVCYDSKQYYDADTLYNWKWPIFQQISSPKALGCHFFPAVAVRTKLAVFGAARLMRVCHTTEKMRSWLNVWKKGTVRDEQMPPFISTQWCRVRWKNKTKTLLCSSKTLHWTTQPTERLGKHSTKYKSILEDSAKCLIGCWNKLGGAVRKVKVLCGVWV